ncbi:MAG: aminotransferase class III-fold pyridoxal phosphate-dependent enzyme [Nitrospirae bacterium]|nr:aminotransferase class III-fold pyridoxal phosphate-dependent enzyme [Nitrospirota bacterium]
MNSGVIVQARNSSTRYPKKMLHDFLGRTTLEWVLYRCGGIETDYKILATSKDADDDVLAGCAKEKGWKVVRGSLNDVLNRFAQAVKEYNLDYLVRITGDCILTDYRLVNFAIQKFREHNADYLVLTQIIDGFDLEVMSGQAILHADKNAVMPSEREHVGPYIRNSGRFKVISIPYGKEELSHIHLSLDYPEDADTIGAILQRLGQQDFTYDDVVKLIKEDATLLDKTKDIVPNAGYFKSIEEDKAFLMGMKGKPLMLDGNNELFKKALDIIPNCSQTFSKSYMQFSAGAAPLFAREGKGCLITDVDGNNYIDCTMGLGACILGYAFDPVLDAVEKQLGKGSSYTLPHYLEYELAELLTQVIPCAEMVRYGKNGSDVTSAAVRLARAHTGRDYIACCGYHGWQDWYIATTTRSKGIPEAVKELTLSFQYNNIESLEKLFEQYRDKIACVIMEPVSLTAPENDFLDKVKDAAHKNNALLVFDEVVTGFRFALGGAQEFFGVMPDIACLGKAMGNGLPVSAIVGRKEYMRLFDEIFFSFTFGGETASIASALATIRHMKDHSVIEYVWNQGKKLKAGIEKLISEKGLGAALSLDGFPVRTVMGFRGEEKESLERKTLFQQECAKRGVLFTGGHNISLPHDDSIIEKTLSVYSEVMDILKYGIAYSMIDSLLEGRLLEPVFRKV